MHQRKSKIILIYCFLLIFFSSISNNSFKILELIKIQNIKISGLDQKNNQIILNKLKYLYLENIFYINKHEIEKLLNSNSLISTCSILNRYLLIFLGSPIEKYSRLLFIFSCCHYRCFCYCYNELFNCSICNLFSLS